MSSIYELFPSLNLLIASIKSKNLFNLFNMNFIYLYDFSWKKIKEETLTRKVW